MQKKVKISIIFLFSLFFLFFFNLSSAHAATLYYNAGTDTDWNTLTNWWTDSGFTVQAGSLPGVSDDVIIEGDVLSNSGSAASVNTLVANGNSQIEISLAVANGATFNDTSVYLDGFIETASPGGPISGLAVAPNGDVYFSFRGGNIYKQTGGLVVLFL